MSVKKLNSFDELLIDEKLKELGNSSNIMMDINNFVHKRIIQDIIGEFDDKFSSNVSCPAIPRTLLFGVVLYAFSKNVSTASEIINLTDSDRYLRTFTCNTKISNTTLKRFLEEGDKILLKKIHLATLVEANGYNILEYLHLYVDGTDAKVNGSKHYKIYREEYETLTKLNEHSFTI
ncbi:MAG: hypothetical protein LBT66_08005 [Methanobrevibacter sp.]|jgi:hypothetical protein|nr:hypothetical protein [Candidatus Methanovirga meridionalis]